LKNPTQRGGASSSSNAPPASSSLSTGMAGSDIGDGEVVNGDGGVVGG